MIISTRLKEKGKYLQTKYQKFREDLELSYDKMQVHVSSKLHRKNINVENTKTSLDTLIENSAYPYLDQPILKITVALPSKVASSKIENFYKEEIDWTRGRFIGDVEKVIIKEGVITEKIFITPKGTKISVKRNELGLLARFRLKEFLGY